MKAARAYTKNPIPELCNDDEFELLYSMDLITDKLIRDYLIRKNFKELISNNVGAREALRQLTRENLKFDSIRKIVYRYGPKENINEN